MIFRKAKASQTNSDLEARDRRRQAEEQPKPKRASGWTPPDRSDTRVGPPQSGTGLPATSQVQSPSKPGPYDAAEVELDTDLTGRVDLGGMQFRPLQNIEVQLQVDEESQTVIALRMIHGDSAMDIQAFAAPKSSGLWEELRREIAADVGRHGGLVGERRGPYGPELEITVTQRQPDGSQSTQANRMIGIDGPRWFLRATMLGRAVQDPSAAAPLLTALAEVVIVRGKAPMAPRDLIPMTVPNQ